MASIRLPVSDPTPAPRRPSRGRGARRWRGPGDPLEREVDVRELGGDRERDPDAGPHDRREERRPGRLLQRRRASVGSGSRAGARACPAPLRPPCPGAAGEGDREHEERDDEREQLDIEISRRGADSRAALGANIARRADGIESSSCCISCTAPMDGIERQVEGRESPARTLQRRHRATGRGSPCRRRYAASPAVPRSTRGRPPRGSARCS